MLQGKGEEKNLFPHFQLKLSLLLLFLPLKGEANWSYAAISHNPLGLPGTVRGKEDFSSRAFEEGVALPTH